jgi:hypothetical protein
VTVSPTAGLANGQTVSIHADATNGTMSEIRAHICEPAIEAKPNVHRAPDHHHHGGPPDDDHDHDQAAAAMRRLELAHQTSPSPVPGARAEAALVVPVVDHPLLALTRVAGRPWSAHDRAVT